MCLVTIEMNLTQFEFNVKSAVSGIGAILSIASNVPVFFLLLTSRRLQEDIATRAIASLAVADLGMETIAPMISAIIGSQGLDYRAPQGLLTFYGCVFTTMVLSAIWHLALVSIIRCCVIIKPLTYRSIFSNRVLYGSIGAVWGICSLTCIAEVSVGIRFGFNYISFTPYLINYVGGLQFAYVYLVLNTIAPALIIISAYFKIFLVVRKQLRTIRPEKNQGLTNLTVSSIKAAKNLFLMILVYGAAYLPILVMFAPLKFPQWYVFTVNWIFCYNASFNAALYVVLHKTVREEYRKLFCPCLKGNRRLSFATGDTPCRGQTDTLACAVAVLSTGD